MEKRQANGPSAITRPARHAPDDSDQGLAALRDATAAFVHLREELLEERAASANARSGYGILPGMVAPRP